MQKPSTLEPPLCRGRALIEIKQGAACFAPVLMSEHGLRQSVHTAANICLLSSCRHMYIHTAQTRKEIQSKTWHRTNRRHYIPNKLQLRTE